MAIRVELMSFSQIRQLFPIDMRPVATEEQPPSMVPNDLQDSRDRICKVFAYPPFTAPMTTKLPVIKWALDDLLHEQQLCLRKLHIHNIYHTHLTCLLR